LDTSAKLKVSLGSLMNIVEASYAAHKQLDRHTSNTFIDTTRKALQESFESLVSSDQVSSYIALIDESVKLLNQLETQKQVHLQELLDNTKANNES
jgi:spore germination protein GerM